MTEASTPLIAEISDRLITAIATGEFLPGSRLPAERTLAGLLRCGRTSVRAALVVLHDHGLIETTRGRSGGSYVRTQWTPDCHAAVLRTLNGRWDDLCDRLEAMRRLHGTIARAAAEHRDEDDVRRIRARLATYRDAPSGRHKQTADASLHAAITEAAKNATLLGMLAELEAAISIAAPTHVWGDPDSMPASELRATGDHDALVRAIAEGRADDAEAVAREHGRIDRELLEAARRRAEAGAARPVALVG